MAGKPVASACTLRDSGPIITNSPPAPQGSRSQSSKRRSRSPYCNALKQRCLLSRPAQDFEDLNRSFVWTAGVREGRQGQAENTCRQGRRSRQSRRLPRSWVPRRDREHPVAAASAGPLMLFFGSGGRRRSAGGCRA